MWTPEIVRARFVEAADTERRQPNRGGVSKAGFWPAYVHSFDDMTGWGTKRLAEERELRMARIPPSSAAISRHDEVMEWTANLIVSEEMRRIVWAWAWCRLTGGSFAARCRKENWSKATAYRNLAIAIDLISLSLCNNRVLLRLPDEKWVRQETPVLGTNLDMLATDADKVYPASPTSIIFEGDRPGHTLTSPHALDGFTKHLASVNKRRRRKQERDEDRATLRYSA